MKKNKVIKIFAILIICVFVIVPMSFAANGAFDFEQFDSASNNDVNSFAKSVMGTGIQVIRTVATGIAIIMITYIAIKYMMAAPNEKAEFKKTASIYIFGAILVFASGNILTIILNFANNIE